MQAIAPLGVQARGRGGDRGGGAEDQDGSHACVYRSRRRDGNGGGAIQLLPP
jgi:hypothetical protein